MLCKLQCRIHRTGKRVLPNGMGHFHDLRPANMEYERPFESELGSFARLGSHYKF